MALNFPSSPTVGQIYPTAGGQQWQWDGTEWVAYGVTSSGGGGGGGTVVTQTGGVNFVHNSLFNIVQRGTGPWSTSGVFTLDRWFMLVNADTLSVSQTTLNDSGRAAVGDEAAVFGLAANVTGTPSTGFSVVRQAIESVHRLSNKTVTVSFWAWSISGTPKIGVSLDQSFGTGGSPSATVLGTGQSVTISMTPTRYSLIFTLPSASGTTLGTNGNDSTLLNFWFSAGSSNAGRAGGIGVQTAQFGIWGVQLEVGTAASPLLKCDPESDLALCQRFFCTSYVALATFGSAFQGIYTTAYFPVTMRAIPTVTFTSTTYINASGITTNGIGTGLVVVEAQVSSTGATGFSSAIGASADI